MIKKYLILFFILSLGVVSCNKDSSDITVDPDDQINNEVKTTAEIFNQLYLWYKTIDNSIDLSTFNSASSYVDAIRYSEKDLWSFVSPLSDFEGLYGSTNISSESKATGYGAGFGLYGSTNNARLMITYVYTNSPFGKEGFQRGDEVVALNGKSIQEYLNGGDSGIAELNKAIFQSTSGQWTIIKNRIDSNEEITKTVGIANFSVNTVLFSQVYNTNSYKIAYLVYNEFLGESSIEELRNVFNTFKSQGATKLILDLRYNGGGSIDTADTLVNLIAGNKFSGQVYNTLRFNDKNRDADEDYIIEKMPEGADIDELVILATKQTASASELIHWGLKDIMKTSLIGTNTHGKPVGMSVIFDKNTNLAIGPIAFQNYHGDTPAEYFFNPSDPNGNNTAIGGISPDQFVTDNVVGNWDNTNDPLLKKALAVLGYQVQRYGTKQRYEEASSLNQETSIKTLLQIPGYHQKGNDMFIIKSAK